MRPSPPRRSRPSSLLPTASRPAAGLLALLLLIAAPAAAAIECPPEAQELTGLIGRGSISLTLEPEPFRAGTGVYAYLLDNLPAAAAISRALGLAAYEIDPLAGGRFELRDRDRLDAVFGEVARRPGLAAYLGEGRYKGRLLGRVSGRALVVVCYAPYGTDRAGPLMANRVETRIRFDSPFLHALGRVFAVLLRGRLTAVMERPVATARATAEAIEASPGLVYTTMTAAAGISPEELREYRRRFGLESKASRTR